jgi:hypothetical protein
MTTQTRDRIGWALILLIIAFSVIRTQQVNGHLTKLTERMAIQQQCTEQFLSGTVEALNERTTVNPDLNKADKNRIHAEAKLFGFVSVQTARSIKNPDQPTQPEIAQRYQELIEGYFNSIQEYLFVLERTDSTQKQNPIPTADDYHTCLSGG